MKIHARQLATNMHECSLNSMHNKVTPSNVFLKETNTEVTAQVASLRKGQKVSLNSLTSALNNLSLIVNFSTRSKEVDMDVSCFMCDASKKTLSDDYFIFYNNDRSKNNSVVYENDDSGNGESFKLDLSRIENTVKRLFFTLTIDGAKSKGFTFSQVNSISVKLINNSSNKIILQYNLDQINGSATSVSICEIYRHGEGWKFCPMGDGLNDTDLEDLCKFYGLNVM